MKKKFIFAFALMSVISFSSCKKVEVLPDELVVTASSKVISIGESVELSVNVDGATFKSSNTSVVSVDESGVVKGIGCGVASVTVTKSSLTSTITFNVIEDASGEKAANAIIGEWFGETEVVISENSLVDEGLSLNLSSDGFYYVTIDGEEKMGYSYNNKEYFAVLKENVSTYDSSDEDTGEKVTIEVSKFTLELLKQNDGVFTSVSTFIPSMSGLIGAYDGVGDGSYYNFVYQLTNIYNETVGGFVISTESYYAGFTDDAYYAKSFKTLDEEGNYVLGFDMIDYADNYEMDSFVGQVDDYGLLYLYGSYDLSTPVYVPSVSHLNFSRVVLGEEENVFGGYVDCTYDENYYVTGYTYTLNEVTYSLLLGYSEEKGCYIVVNNGETEYCRIYASGINNEVVFSNSTVVAYPDMTKQLEGSYYYDGHYIEVISDYDYDLWTYYISSVTVDGTECEISKVVKDDLLSIQFVFNEKTYVLSPYKQSVSIKLTVDSNSVILGEIGALSDSIVGDFATMSDGVISNISISLNEETHKFNVTYNGNNYEAEIVYTVGDRASHLEFEVSGEKHVISTYYVETASPSLLDFDGVCYVESSALEVEYEDLTNGKVDAKFTGTTMAFAEDSARNVSLVVAYDEASFSYVPAFTFSYEGNKEGVIYLDGIGGIEVVIDGVSQLLFIPEERFESLIGEYVYVGTYGEEYFKMNSDGTFTADTLNASGNGLIRDVEYEYILQETSSYSYGVTVGLFFIVDKESLTGVTLIKDGYSLCVGSTYGNRYVDTRIASINGTFENSDGSAILYINSQSIYYNGDELTISSLSKEGSVITIEGSSGTDSYSIVASLDSEGEVSSLVVNDAAFTTSSLSINDWLGKEFEYNGNTFIIEEYTSYSDGTYISLVMQSSFMKLGYGKAIPMIFEGHQAFLFAGGFVPYVVYVDGETNVMVELA